jgi:hypothetical protein
MYLGTIYLSYLPNFGPIGLQIWLPGPGGHLGKKQSPVTLELMAGLINTSTLEMFY